MKTVKLSAILECGNLWKKSGKSRVYFNKATKVLEAAGYKLDFYKTGNVKSAFDPEGDKISNAAAGRLMSAIDGEYFDNISDKFSADFEDILGVKIENDIEEDEEAGEAENDEKKAAPAEPAVQWHRIPVNVQNIQRTTEKAVLIAMPHSSDYDGYDFWFPKSLVRDGSHSYEVRLSVHDDMDITAKRVSEKTRKVLDEVQLSAEDLVNAFGRSCGVNAGKAKKVETVTIVPEHLEPVKGEADAALVR